MLALRANVLRLHRGETVIADRIAAATVLFSDLVDFTALAERLAPERMIEVLGSRDGQRLAHAW